MAGQAYQPCGVARLLSAALRLPLAQMFTAVGLELCPVCGEASSNPTYYPCLRLLRLALPLPSPSPANPRV